MPIRTPRELGAFARDARKRRKMTQAQLAERARVSRTWVVDLEAGKRTLEIGLVLSALDILGVVINLGQVGALSGQMAAKSGAYAALEIPPAETLLDRLHPKAGSRS